MFVMYHFLLSSFRPVLPTLTLFSRTTHFSDLAFSDLDSGVLILFIRYYEATDATILDRNRPLLSRLCFTIFRFNLSPVSMFYHSPSFYSLTQPSVPLATSRRHPLYLVIKDRPTCSLGLQFVIS